MVISQRSVRFIIYVFPFLLFLLLSLSLSVDRWWDYIRLDVSVARVRFRVYCYTEREYGVGGSVKIFGRHGWASEERMDNGGMKYLNTYT